MVKWDIPKLIAHRGASAYAPENTLAALTQAHEQGAMWVEADVRLTRDGEAIIFHDAKLSRCTQIKGMVSKTSYSVISTLDAGRWFSNHFLGEKIPTLDEWLQAAAELRCGIVLDLKPGRFQTKGLIDHVALSLSRYWSEDLPPPLISSTSSSCLKAVSRLKMNWDLAYITDKERGNWQKVAKETGCVAVHIDHHFLSQRWIQLIKKHGLRIAAYTINDRDRALQLFDWGINSIFSDDPQLLKGGIGR